MRSELFCVVCGVLATLAFANPEKSIPWLETISVNRGGLGEDDVKSSTSVLADGTRVWNRWSEVPDRRFRLETAVRTDGAVEITMSSQMDGECTNRTRYLELRLPRQMLEGKGYEAIKGNSWHCWRETGAFGPGAVVGPVRWLAVGGLTFDFNPLGVGDALACYDKSVGWTHCDAVKGIARITREGDSWLIRLGDEVTSSFGGFVGAKLVIRKGVYADYDRYHAFRSNVYHLPLDASHNVAFASPRRGTTYAEGDVLYCGARGYGWDSIVAKPERRPLVGHREGVYYSALTDIGESTYVFDRLTDGYYLFTFAAGNYTGATNRFSVTVGDRTILDNESVPVRKLRRISLPVHVSQGRLEVRFSGTWLVSTMALQPLLADAEDFYVARKFWLTDGYEPAVLYRNSDNPEPFRPAVADDLEELPEPGTEFAAPPRDPPEPVELPNPDRSDLAWTRNARIQRVLANGSTFAEFDDDGVLERYIDREVVSKGTTVVMLSGMLSRHTYSRELIESSRRNIGRIITALHRRNIKVMDHQDVTLLWNVGRGYRLMMEDTPMLLRKTTDNLPSFQYCVNNPEFCERVYDYVRSIAELGADAFQLDEVYLWHHGCTCRHCRERFRRETGWQMPLNECDPAWQDAASPFRRLWGKWRVRCCTDFYVNLRRRLKDVNDHLVLGSYATPNGFASPWAFGLGQSLEDLSRAINFFGIEVMSRCEARTTRSELPNRRASNIVSYLRGAPAWDWYYNADWKNDYVAWALSTMTGRTPLLSEVEKTDTTPDYVSFGSGPAAMKRIGATPVAEVGLWFSSRSRDEGAGPAWQKTLFATAQTLEALHVPYEFIPDGLDDVGRLKKYKVLFVLGLNRRTEREDALFRAYAAAGGRLVSDVGDVTDLCELVYTPPMTYDFAPDAARLAGFRKRLAEFVAGAEWWTVDAPKDVHTSVWREKDGSWVIHFLNMVGAVPKRGEKLVRAAGPSVFGPVGQDVRFVVPSGRRAVAVSPDFAGEVELLVKRLEDGRLEVTLPQKLLAAYSLVRVTH